MSEIKIDLTGIEDLKKYIEQIKDNASKQELGQYLKVIGARIVREAVLERFRRTKTGPDGQRWKELSQATIQRKIREGRNNGILRFTNALMNSVGYFVKDLKLYVGAGTTSGSTKSDPSKYAGVHQFGWPAKKIPARPFLPVNKLGREEETIIKEETEKFLKKIFTKK